MKQSGSDQLESSFKCLILNPVTYSVSKVVWKHAHWHLKSSFTESPLPNLCQPVPLCPGVPLTVLADFPVIKAHHKRMSEYPSIAEYYQTQNNPKRVGMATVA